MIEQIKPISIPAAMNTCPTGYCTVANQLALFSGISAEFLSEEAYKQQMIDRQSIITEPCNCPVEHYRDPEDESDDE